MYEQIFHFNSRPFTATPYVKHYFAGDAIHQSLSQATLCIDRGTGPVVVVGATGTGKSLLLAMLEEQYQSQFNVVNLGCARLDERRELLQSVLHELQLPFKDLSETELRFSLIDYLKPSEKCPNGILLLVDEAHSLSNDLLDEIRLITNFVRDGQPRVRLVMAGSQRLEENLNDSKLESFNQRIAARCYINNMSRDETARYVTEHIDRAGGDGSTLFNADSLRAIHDVSDGCPRLVNQVCDHALILAATRAENVINGDCIQEAWADVQSIPGSFKSTSTPAATVAGLKQDESWTVIEFGQLDDDDPESEQGTVYEFENSSAVEPAGSVDASHLSDAVEEEVISPGINQPASELNSESADVNDDTRQPIEADGWDSPHDAEFESADLEADNAEISEPVDESDLHDETQLNADEQTEATSELNDQVTKEASDAAAAAELEAQLEAVFGSEPELNSGNSEISDLELEQSQIFDQVETEQTAIFGNETVSESVEVVSSDETGELVNEMDPCVEEEAFVDNVWIEAKADEDSSVDELPVCEEQTPSSQQDEVEDSQSDAVSETIETDSPAEDLIQATQDEVVEIEEAEQPKLRQPVQTINPFDESFAEEENLIDRYAPFVAHQNQSSLSVTSEDLSMLTPNDELEHDDESTPAIFETEHETGDPDDADAHAEIQQVEPEAVDEQQAESVSDHDTDSGTVDEPNSVSSLEGHEENPGHNNDIASHDVRIQAEQILKRLNDSQFVSCETPTAGVADEDNVVDEALGETVEQPDEADVLGAPPAGVPHVALADTDFEQQSAALDESQQILNEILEQRSAIAQQRDSGFSDDCVANADANDQTSQDAGSHSRETGDADQEMIIVNRMEQESEVKTPVSEDPIPFPTTPVSTGRAARMDYQQLFNQLREISNPEDQ